MAGESSQQKRRRSKPVKEQPFPISKFGKCVIALADGIKPGDWLARRARCTERHANLIIRGDRRPNLRAIHALTAEFLD